jgi:hypothetical protein
VNNSPAPSPRIFVQNSEQLGKTPQLPHDHLKKIDGDLTSAGATTRGKEVASFQIRRGASIRRVLQVDKSATSCKQRNHILWV